MLGVWAFSPRYLLTFLFLSSLGTLAGSIWILSSAQADHRELDEAHLRVRAAMVRLKRTPTGQALLTQALKKWAEPSEDQLLAHIEPAETSRTDATLTRHWDPKTGKERMERTVSVYLRSDQEPDDLLLDLAHELTHAVSRSDWDPYDPDLTAVKYIRNAIEGEGGEVAAVMTECQVALEVQTQTGVSSARCLRYRDARGKIDRQEVTLDFYRVGSWKKALAESLGSDLGAFPLISTDRPKLFSSTGQAPYPNSLLDEYRQINRIACDNSRRRIQNGSRRSPATASAANTFLTRRCE